MHEIKEGSHISRCRGARASLGQPRAMARSERRQEEAKRSSGRERQNQKAAGKCLKKSYRKTN